MKYFFGKIAGLMALSFVFYACIENSNKVVRLVSPEEMKTLIAIDEVQLVDVRTPEEFMECHLNSAKNINIYAPDFKQKIAQLDKEKPVYLYCRSGKRSAKAAKILQELGFKKVYDLDGGIKLWQEEQLEVVK